MPRIQNTLTDTVSYFADESTRELLTSLYGDAPEGDWQDAGLCAQVDPDTWFPEQGGSVREAKRICSGCPVRADCLAFALANDEHFGVWGGLSEHERKQIRRASRSPARAA